MPLAVFRFDAAPAIGSGHAVRCLALAQKLTEFGWRVVVAASPDTFETVRVPDGMEHLVLDSGSEQQVVRIGAEVGTADLLIVDHYGLDARFETACRTWAKHVLVIDDLADRPHDCDFLLDQTLGREESDYGSLVPADCRMLLGPQFALLREEFTMRPADSLSRCERVELKAILVSMGGTDPNDMAAKVVRGILDSGLEITVDVVLGATQASPDLLAAAESGGDRVRLMSRVGDMADLMAAADVAIGAGGGTSWERCYMGLPTLLIVTADNQKLIAARLAEAGAARVLGWHAEVGRELIAAAVWDLAGDIEAVERMSMSARKLCDGKGVRRALATLSGSERDRSGRPVTLRLADAEDTWTIFAWQTSPGVRRYMTNPEVPTEAEHFAWMTAKLDDPRAWFCMVEAAGRPVGVLRLDEAETDPDKYVVAILVAPDQVRKGIGTAALRIANRLMPGKHLVARVAPENSASMRLFVNAGYATEADGLFHCRPVREVPVQ